MLAKKIDPFHDAAKALAHCEVCLDEIQIKQLPAWSYEFFYNSFIFYINQSWELATVAFQLSNNTPEDGQALVEHVRSMRDDQDALLVYLREARNQLAHRENVLWISHEEPKKPEGLGAITNLDASFYTTDHRRYSCKVLPSLSFNFAGTDVAAKPVFDKKKNLVPVPLVCNGLPIDNSPLGIMKAAYEFYGQSFGKLIQCTRES